MAELADHKKKKLTKEELREKKYQSVSEQLKPEITKGIKKYFVKYTDVEFLGLIMTHKSKLPLFLFKKLYLEFHVISNGDNYISINNFKLLKPIQHSRNEISPYIYWRIDTELMIYDKIEQFTCDIMVIRRDEYIKNVHNVVNNIVNNVVNTDDINTDTLNTDVNADTSNINVNTNLNTTANKQEIINVIEPMWERKTATHIMEDIRLIIYKIIFIYVYDLLKMQLDESDMDDLRWQINVYLGNLHNEMSEKIEIDDFIKAIK